MKSEQNTSTRPVFRLIAHDNLSSAEALAKLDGDLIKQPELIDAAISLYLQWPEYRCAYLVSDAFPEPRPVTIGIDSDELEPSELRLTSSTPIPVNAGPGQRLSILFEIFNVSYYFTAELLIASQDIGPNLPAILSIPRHLIVKKSRSIPRHVVKEETLKKLPPMAWLDAEGKATPCIPLEVGLSGLKVSTQTPLREGQGLFQVGQRTFRAHLQYRRDKSIIVKLSQLGQEDFGDYFELYAQIAHPTLVARRNVNPRELYNTYLSTGFFDKYVNTSSPEESETYFQKLSSTWSNLASEHHRNSADFVSVTKSNKIVGASSLIKAFQNDRKPVWILTQLCVKAEPEFFENTFDLYLWRVAYLFGTPNDIDVTCWYDGNSRFLEKIWTKFIRQAGKMDTALWPVSIRTATRNDLLNIARSGVRLNTQNLGKIRRTLIQQSGIIGGVDPAYLNFGKLCDHVASVPPDAVDSAELKSLAASLMDATESENCQIRITTVDSNRDSQVSELPEILLNRFCYFSKADLPFLYASILHSVAIMERKHKGRRP